MKATYVALHKCALPSPWFHANGSIWHAAAAARRIDIKAQCWWWPTDRRRRWRWHFALSFRVKSHSASQTALHLSFGSVGRCASKHLYAVVPYALLGIRPGGWPIRDHASNNGACGQPVSVVYAHNGAGKRERRHLQSRIAWAIHLDWYTWIPKTTHEILRLFLFWIVPP